jgi:hypothetical protein
MDDDWYRATTPTDSFYYLSRSGSRPTWRPDVSASPMGCLEQFQWCNSAYPRDSGCGPLASLMDSIYGAAPLFNVTSEDLAPDRPLSSNATQARFMWPLLALLNYPNTLPGLLANLGTGSLASHSTLFGGIQSPLPHNQWQLDVLQWWHMIAAATQAVWLVLCILRNVSLFFVLSWKKTRRHWSKILHDHLANLSLVSRMPWHVREIMACRDSIKRDDSRLTRTSCRHCTRLGRSRVSSVSNAAT